MLRFGLVWLGLCCVLVWGSGVKSDDNEVDIGPGVNLKWRLREAKALAWYNKYYLNNFNCEQNCTVDSSSWGPARYACTSDGALVPNSFCSSSMTYIDCKSAVFHNHPEGEYSIVAPGSCICPADCSSRGSCGFAGCTCDPGYTGEDCKLVECGDQKCNGRGTCASMSDLEIDTCVCDDGYATNDCSAEMKELPPIPNLLGVNQYTSWDDYGDNNPIFNESTIAQIYITINPEDLSDLTLPSNQDQRIYKHANFSFYNGAVSKRIEDVGFRVKGGSSRNFAKKSWKISFTHFNDDQKWAQQKKISLKSASMDPLYLRERAALASITSMGGPAQRSSHTTLYINGQYWGLYIILEEAGSNQFLQSRFGNEDGSLWKITDLNTLNWVGDDQEAYRNNTQYVAANDQAEDDYTPLIKLVDILNNSPDDQFEAQISSIMNVEFFLRTLSAEVATGNWDGGFDGNNYYLYYNTDSLFYYYRYDLDISFGSTEEWFHGANRNVWTWGEHWVGRRLIMRILRVPSFQSVYASYLMKAITYTNWDPKGDYTKRLEIIHQEIAPPAKDDQWHTIDQYGYSYPEFENNLYLPVTRPNVYPPQGVFDKKDVTVFLSVSEFLIERVATIEKQVAEGPRR